MHETIISSCGGLLPPIYQTSSELLTISKVGVLGTILFMRLRSSLVTKPGVIGTRGVYGWYGEYGMALAVNGVLPVGDKGSVLSKTVCLVV